MVQGLWIDVKGDELARRVGERATHHRTLSTRLQEKLRDLGKARSATTRRATVNPFLDNESPRKHLERQIRQHDERATAFEFIRDHIASGETYRLSENDLRQVELFPERHASPFADVGDLA